MSKTHRGYQKEGKSAEFYRIHFHEGGAKKCHRCGGYSNEFSGEIQLVNGKWYHISCVDPED